MQALTPLLFSMLFPRKNVVERELSRHHENDTASQSLLSHRHSVSNELPRFQEGYLLQDRTRHSQEHQQQRQHRSSKARKHRSAPTMNSNANARREVSDSLDMDNGNGITRANTFPPARRSAPPKRLSLDPAALATFPMLDGLGDTSRPRDYYYASPSPSPSHSSRNTAKSSYSNDRSSPKPKSLRKKQSQELAASRSSTSSVCSMVSDSSSLSSSPSLGEPRTPTRSPPREYRHSMNNTKDLIVLHGFGEEDGKLCMSPKSSNFIDAEISPLHDNHVMTGYGKSVVVGARGQRQLIAH